LGRLVGVLELEFKYNKSALNELGQQLKMRQNALPTLKSKEAALRIEVKQAKAKALEYREKLEQRIKDIRDMVRLWSEFDADLVRLKNATYRTRTVAGVKVPELDKLEFELAEISQYHKPDWFLDGIKILEDLTRLGLQRDVASKAMDLLEYARKKTTQKVNLYEKVQIPAYQEAISKIKRFLEDEENLSKAAQKIMKRKSEKAARK
jgi:V/A-type H+-transporting ATPase subunit D